MNPLESQKKGLSDDDAAALIQRSWRRRNDALSAHARWEEAAKHAKLQTLREEASEGKNDPSNRWKRAAFLANQLGGSDQIHTSRLRKQKNSMSTDESGSHGNEDAKILETQHWLELTDSKHRYGSNLKYYHRQWLQEDTEENFFRWLDRGSGKNVSLKECPREQLERERIIYLSAEQRSNYLVIVDDKGLLRWARNNELVDTTAGRWQDSGDGSGIVPFDVSRSDQQVVRRTSFELTSTQTQSSEVSAGSIESQNATHYADSRNIKNPVKRWLRKHLTIKGWTEKMLRKTVRRNTWIYVADKQFNIYIGIKNTGTFQHSSFLSGGKVTSAGLISVHNGMIHKLSPLSGHYRTSIDNFRLFVSALSEKGVDMHRVEISRAEVALWGIEHVKRAEKKKNELEKKGKDKTEQITEKVFSYPQSLGENLRWRRDILEGRKRNRKDN